MKQVSTRVRTFICDSAGVALVYVIIVLVILLAAVAFGIDSAFAVFTKARLQNAADASALAGVALVPENSGALTSPEKDVVIAEAQAFAIKNMPVASDGTVLVPGDIAFGHWDSDGS